MTGKFSGDSVLSVAGLTVILTLLIAFSAVAQTSADGNPLDFLPVDRYASNGLGTTGAAVADVNGDGIPDIVYHSQCCPTSWIGTLLGNGDGSFQPAISGVQVDLYIYTTGWATADLNGDGKADVVLLNWLNNIAIVYLGNGDGTFRYAASYDPGGIWPQTVVIADVNRDGIPDLVVGNDAGPGVSSASVAVLLGNGDGTFQAASPYDTGGTTDSALAVGDLNGDGNPDFAVVNQCANGSNCQYGSFVVVLSNGKGTFQQPVIYDTGATNPASVAIGDVNGDGKPDLLVVNGNGTFAVLLGNGDGTFQPAATHPAAGASITLADLNGDGMLDIVQIIECNLPGNRCEYGFVAVLLGNGDGTFQSAVTFPSGGAKASSVAVADLNGDGWLDVVMANQQCTRECHSDGQIGVLLNNSGPHVPTTTALASSLNPAPQNAHVTYTATVTSADGSKVSRSVLFYQWGLVIAKVQLINNQATYTTSYGSCGIRNITAQYLGDTSHTGSSSPTLTEHVPCPSKTTLATSGSPSYVGQAVTFAATVTSNRPINPDGGVVTFYDGVQSLASVVVVAHAAVYTTSSLSVGAHTIKAMYSGTNDLRSSSGTVKQSVLKNPTTTTLTSSPNPSSYGQPVTFTATITPTGSYPLTGKVKFWDGTTSLGSAALNNGIAKLTKSTLAVGTHPITAKYLGDAYNDKSTSPVVNQVVQ